MKKLLLLLTILVTTVGALSATTWSSTATSASGWDAILEGSSSTTSKAPTKWTDTSNDLKAEWIFDYTWADATKIYYTRGKNGLQFGSSKNGIKELVLSTTSFTGTITQVTVTGAKSNGSAKLQVTVGGTEFTIDGASSKTLSSTATDCTFSGSATGEIVISFTDITANDKYVGLSGLKVEYTTGGGTTTDNLGDIKVQYGENGTYVNNEEYASVDQGTTFSISAENAEKIEILDKNNSNAVLASGNGATLSWTPAFTGVKVVTVKATKGNDSKEITFNLTVNPTSSDDDLGDIIVKYGDVVIENQYESSSATPIDIPVGTTLSVSSTNATMIQLQIGSNYEAIEGSI